METLVLDPHGPFSEVPRSDTLFGAICWGIRRSDGNEELEEVLERFAEGDPPFRISSAFPYLDGGSELLLPKMVSSLPSVEVSEKEDIEAIKKLKRTAYVPSEVFSKLADGEMTQMDLFEAYKRDLSIDGCDYRLSSEFLVPDGHGEPYRGYETPGISVNRLTNSTDGNLFHRKGVRFSEGSGLYLLAEGETGYIKRALSVTQDEGIGGGKSVGKGHYSLRGARDETPTIETETEAELGDFCTLSLCVPADEEMEGFFEHGYYRTETRKGVVENSLASPDSVWKRKVLAISEGSVLPSPSEGEPGHNPVVADHFENGVQHYGYAFPVGVEVGE